MNRKELGLLFTLAALNFTNIMDFMIMMPLGPQLMRLWSISPQQFGFIVSSYTFSAGVSGILGAFWMDKVDRKKALIIVYVGFLAGTFACSFATSYMSLVMARVFTGMFGGILGALVLAIVGDSIEPERRATAMGVVMAAFSAASVFGVPFGLLLANIYSWHAPFLLLAAMGSLILIAIATFIPSMKGHIKTKQHQNGPFEVLTRVMKTPNQLRALLFMALLMFGQFSIIPYISPYMVSNVGFTEQQLTYIYLCGGLLTIFTSPFIGKLADSKGKAKVFRWFALLLIIPVLLITNMPRVPIYYVLMATTLFFIFVSGRMIPAMAMITSTVEPHHRGSFMSVNSSVQQLSAGLAAFLAGFIVYKNAAGELINYELVGGVAVLSGILSVLLVKKLKAVDIKKEDAQPEELKEEFAMEL